VQLIIVGEGYERGALTRLVHDQQADAFVHFEGRISPEALVDHYRSAWLVASASSHEGWGMTLTEAAACGTPAVATRIDGHVDVVQDQHSGLLANNQHELTAAIEHVLTHGDLRRALGAAAQTQADGLTWDRTALEVLQSVADQCLR
jgi:glycosyltransferase involved in cell wall biosynthesis